MTTTNWNQPQKFLFRFFFVYFIFYTAPWAWTDGIPLVSYIGEGYYWVLDQIVQFANKNIFKAYKELVPLNGSGDTSWAYTQLWLFLLISFISAIIWSIADRNKANYSRWNYWLCLIIRYFLAINAFGYGIIKLFALQMPFPSISQLATPLGEFLPMRLSWMFMGYSAPYQIFSGVLEVLVGFLLFYRRTASAGAMLAAAVFTNVVAMNLAYDIPVKLFSIHLAFMSFFLMAQEYKRIASFFFFNQVAIPSTLYQQVFSKKWKRMVRVGLKLLFVVMIIALTFYNSFERSKSMQQSMEQQPIKSGIYDVTAFAINSDTIPPIAGDSSRWSQVILHASTTGSMITSDTLFRKSYGRSYFGYFVDTTQQQITFRWGGKESDSLFTMRYTIPDSTSITLRGPVKGDTLFVRLKRTNKQYRLAEKQFHWLSEYNR